MACSRANFTIEINSVGFFKVSYIRCKLINTRISAKSVLLSAGVISCLCSVQHFNLDYIWCCAVTLRVERHRCVA